MNRTIDNISRKTSELRTKVNSLKDKDAGSIQNYKDIHGIYNKYLLENWILSLSIIGGSGLIYLTTFK